MMLTDSELIRLAARGDRSAFDALVARHYQRVKWYARRFCTLIEDADDIVQDVFVTAYDRLGQLEQPDRFGGWLMAIARTECLMWRRRTFAQASLFSIDAEDSPAQYVLDRISADVALENARLDGVRERITQALAALTTAQRQAVQLHYISGYDYSETASLLNVPESAVRGRLDRARAALRKELSDMTPPAAKSWILDKPALHALRWAATFCKTIPEFPALDAILITEDGRIVSTDSHRLMYFEVDSLKEVPRTLIHADLGRTLRDDYPSVTSARLRLGESAAVIELEDGRKIKGRLADVDYPEWQQVVPSDWACTATAPASRWLSELNVLETVMGTGVIHQQDPELGRVLLVLSPQEGRIGLRLGSEVADSDSPLREISASFPAEYAPESKEVMAAFQLRYLLEAVSALATEPGTMLELLAKGEVWPILMRAPGGKSFVVTMPMQRHSVPPAPTPAESAEACQVR